MKREDIEKAAVGAICENYGCNGKYPCTERDYCIYGTGKNTAFDCNECGADEFDKGFIAGANWRINSVWHSITVIPDCHRFIVFLPKKSTIGSKNPIMGILEENRTFISSRPGCILCRLDEMESWAYLDDLLP